MTDKKSANKNTSATIALNRKAKHDYRLGKRLEAGLVLQGWEVKGLRAGHVQLRDSYVIIRNGEAWLIGARITPLPTTAAHTGPEPTRTRKLLLHQKELAQLHAATARRGETLVPTALYWKNGRAKLEFALASGRQAPDKRAAAREAEWERDKQRLLKSKIAPRRR